MDKKSSKIEVWGSSGILGCLWRNSGQDDGKQFLKVLVAIVAYGSANDFSHGVNLPVSRGELVSAPM